MNHEEAKVAKEFSCVFFVVFASSRFNHSCDLIGTNTIALRVGR